MRLHFDRTEVALCPVSPTKVRFGDRLSAQIRLARLRHPSMRDTASGTVPKRAYRCAGCAGFHLTSKEKK